MCGVIFGGMSRAGSGSWRPTRFRESPQYSTTNARRSTSCQPSVNVQVISPLPFRPPSVHYDAAVT
eukprot:scaffold114022_cov33-Phaeocystis_antarctica.AAC.1